jgi:D-alanyl-D-alanine carboxypeptidase
MAGPKWCAPRSLAACVAILAVIGVIVAGCGDDDASSVPLAFELTTTPMSAADQETLPDVVANGAVELGPAEAPGVLYGVWDPKRGVFQKGYGLADVEAKTPAEPDQSFRIGSITKTFTATAVLLLVDDGKVDLDKPVATYTGNLTDALPDGRIATVRELLSMTSGFPEYTEKSTDPFGQSVLDPEKEWTAKELVAAAAKNPGTPRGTFSYSNTNYIVLGDLVTQITGQDYAAFLKDRVLDPVGLPDTIIPSQTDTAPVGTHGYLNDSWAEFSDAPSGELLAAGGAGTDVTDWSTSAGGTAGNGVSTLADLARWASADFGTVLLSASSQKARLDFGPADAFLPGTKYGLGLQELVPGWHSHGGEILGWETQLMANPSTGQVVLVNANSCCGYSLKNPGGRSRPIPPS